MEFRSLVVKGETDAVDTEPILVALVDRSWMLYGLLLAGVPGVVLLDQAGEAAWCLLAVTVLGCLAAAAHPWTVIRVGTLVLAVWFVLALVLLRDDELGYGLYGLAFATASQALAWLVGSWVYGMRATSPRRTH